MSDDKKTEKQIDSYGKHTRFNDLIGPLEIFLGWLENQSNGPLKLCFSFF